MFVKEARGEGGGGGPGERGGGWRPRGEGGGGTGRGDLRDCLRNWSLKYSFHFIVICLLQKINVTI